MGTSSKYDPSMMSAACQTADSRPRSRVKNGHLSPRKSNRKSRQLRPSRLNCKRTRLPSSPKSQQVPQLPPKVGVHPPATRIKDAAQSMQAGTAPQRRGILNDTHPVITIIIPPLPLRSRTGTVRRSTDRDRLQPCPPASLRGPAGQSPHPPPPLRCLTQGPS